ncbi:Z-ring formation inhibitor MciZ [Paenibacillus lemnae]|uniref:Z-ring formation inhibitor MciZ n=1 Tax=Paenibacillus lemnae TaxID=1330551 RepID=A0A848M7E4_PAELE|nr:Z-ring formation inhibitor MciZ [Paenibacillus lemnae]NMO96907.1 Z-ring formation inhibitor MciZ [Paenibacillus lemnae]
MKCYRNENSIRWVGQAWQIKAMLKQWQKEWGPEVLVLDILQKQNKDKHEK